MISHKQEQKEAGRKSLGLRRVATGLFRAESSGKYYIMVKRRGKVFRKSLKTKDRKKAERDMKDELGKVDRLKEGMGKMSFFDLLASWRQNEFEPKDLKPGARIYRELCIKGLEREWPSLWATPARSITKADCKAWLVRRKEKISAQLLNNEISTLKMILEHGVNEGVIADNPADSLKRVRIPRVEAVIPTREEFANLVSYLRGRRNFDAADFVEILGYSGMRCGEAASILWSEVDFEKGRFTVSGGEVGTKNRDTRTIPLFPPLRRLLERIRGDREGLAVVSDKIMLIGQCHMAISSVCKKLGLPHFGHHSMRHFFASNAIEAGVDFKTVAIWLGHKDGGVLVAKIYSHLREEHSTLMAEKMIFDATALPENVVEFQKAGAA